MATRVQFRRGTTSEHSSFTGAVGEVTVDTDKDVVVVHDGSLLVVNLVHHLVQHKHLLVLKKVQ